MRRISRQTVIVSLITDVILVTILTMIGHYKPESFLLNFIIIFLIGMGLLYVYYAILNRFKPNRTAKHSN